jgi:hypothetical protein
MSSRKSAITNSLSINGNNDRVILSAPAQAMREKGDPRQPCQAKPFDRGIRKRKTRDRRHGREKKDKGSFADSGKAPLKASCGSRPHRRDCGYKNRDDLFLRKRLPS